MAIPIGSLLGLGAAVGTALPRLTAGATGAERRMSALSAGRGPSAAQTMLQQQAGRNVRNALGIAASQPGGMGTLAALRSAENMNRDAMDSAAQARVQEQLGATQAAANMQVARQNEQLGMLNKIGAGLAGAGAAFDAQSQAADQAAAAAAEAEKNREQQLKLARLGVRSF